MPLTVMEKTVYGKTALEVRKKAKREYPDWTVGAAIQKSPGTYTVYLKKEYGPHSGGDKEARGQGYLVKED